MIDDERVAEYVADAIEDVKPTEPQNESERVQTAYLAGELSSDASVLLSLLAGHAMGLRHMAEDFNYAWWRVEAVRAEVLFNEGWDLVWRGNE